MADIFAVVADHTRRELLGILLRRRSEGIASGDASVSELVAELALSQPTVSKHLKVLREAGLVTVREKGQHRYYRIEPDGLARVGAWVGPFLPAAAHDPAAPTAADAAASEPASTPEPAPTAAPGGPARDALGGSAGDGGVDGTGMPAASTRVGAAGGTTAGAVAGARVAAALGRLAADLAFRVRRS